MGYTVEASAWTLQHAWVQALLRKCFVHALFVNYHIAPCMSDASPMHCRV